MTLYLKVDQVVAIHDRIHVCPVRDLGALHSAVDKPRAGWGEYEQYPTIAEKGGALLQGLAMNHPFFDANKRTAWAATQIFLGVNQAPIYQIPDEHGADFVVRVIEDRLDVDEIALWLAYRFER